MTDLRQRIAGLSPKKHELLLRLLKSKGQNGARRELPIPTIDRKGGLPLSYVQERVWITNQLVSAGAGGLIGGAMRVSGPVNETALERAAKEIVCRHEGVRTKFPKVGDPRVLLPDDGTAPMWSLTDLRGAMVENRVAEALRLAQDEVVRTSDLSVGPLIRSMLFVLEDTEHLLVLVVHHAV